jgi:hypothetical protein
MNEARLSVRKSLRRDWLDILLAVLVVVTATVFALVARNGQKELLLKAAGAAYAVVALTFLVRQLVESMRPNERVWHPPGKVAAAGAVLGGTLIWLDSKIDVGWPFVLGIVLIAVSCGYGELAMRDYAAARNGQGKTEDAWAICLRGVPPMVLGISLLTVGLNLMTRAATTMAGGVLAALGVVLLYFGAGLRADHHGQPALDPDGMATKRAAVLGVIGLALTVVAAILAYRLLETPWAVWIFVGVAVLVVVVVVRPMVEVVAVLALVAFLGYTPAAVSLDSHAKLQDVSGDDVLVILGDSYISGEGASAYFEGTDGQVGERGEADQCRRAPTSWAVQAGELHFSKVLFLACSGAQTKNVARTPEDGEPWVWTGPKPRPQSGEADTQLDMLAAEMERTGMKPKMIVMSLGGNDSGFSTIGAMCLAPGNCQDRAELWTGTLETLEVRLKEVYHQIDLLFPDVPVVVTAYPDPIFDGADPRCDDVTLSQGDRRFIESFGSSLNARVYRAADASDFYFLADMEGALNNDLKLCDPDRPQGAGVNFVGIRAVAGDPSERFNPKNWYHNSLHPNATGHTAMLSVFEKWYAEFEKNPDPRAPEDIAADLENSLYVAFGASNALDEENPQPLCTPADAVGSARGCEDEGVEWALSQVTIAILARGWGLLIAAGAVGSWFMWVSIGRLLSLRRRSSEPGLVDVV